ncbi:helix-turn-helix domain-containing protein [Companilactobacillus allii]|uniref:AraC family transcriptional regulator n=1 Tax=Companilactobacillus allii TaxID=1847728 RepID=A0A1P8Q4S3_9LACO|nr:Ada metal-binding domain-containing protein [Companilactobacillus allii]APX72835.1 AraC family transcriptional regulator [Companilactobacillus allii]USQ67622.1 helix-turn-helix domain-containing protein [Companilactobacillus allii]
MKKYPLTKNRWNSIINNNQKADKTFYYGVKTTKIFCKPSCPSKNPSKGNVCIFKTSLEAINQGFRPCKRCQPTGSVPNDAWVHEIKTFIDNNYQKKLTLNIIAEECHGSPFHLQKTFKKECLQSPSQYLTQIRLVHAKKLLVESNLTIKSIAIRIGFSSDTYFSTVFKHNFFITPDQYRLNKLSNL